MAIPKGHKANYETLLRAARSGDLVLVECTDAITGQPVYTLCAVSHGDSEYTLGPLARMFDGNPYEAVNPPTMDPVQ